MDARIVEVPANADFVIEGYVDPREPLRDEGPFGDHTGHYTWPEPYPVFHVTAITHRNFFRLWSHSESPQETQPLSRFECPGSSRRRADAGRR